jgi:meso-butanediol dehydrogenase/(S,S)-butanediol dehydrogenase/diacetyl reductase
MLTPGIKTPEDIAGLVSFLAGKDSNQITGQSMIVDGGSVYS